MDRETLRELARREIRRATLPLRMLATGAELKAAPEELPQKLALRIARRIARRLFGSRPNT